MEELLEVLLLDGTDRSKLNRVETQLLQVHQVKVPVQERNQIVQGHTWSSEEAVIVGVDRNFHTVSKEGPGRVSAKVMNVAKNFVRDRARLDADILLLDHLYKVWMH